MKKIDLGQTIAILANVGVIAGIVFLAIEVSQQNTINLLSGRDAAVENFNGFRTLLLENPDLMEIWNAGLTNGELTSIEDDRFQLLCENSIWGRVTLYNRYDALSLDEEMRGLVRAVAYDISKSERFRQCWDEWKDFGAGQRFSDFVGLVEAR